jgi:hypothetical protein
VTHFHFAVGRHDPGVFSISIRDPVDVPRIQQGCPFFGMGTTEGGVSRRRPLTAGAQEHYYSCQKSKTFHVRSPILKKLKSISIGIVGSLKSPESGADLFLKYKKHSREKNKRYQVALEVETAYRDAEQSASFQPSTRSGGIGVLENVASTLLPSASRAYPRVKAKGTPVCLVNLYI